MTSRSNWSQQLRAAWWVWLLGLVVVIAAVMLFRWLSGEVLARQTIFFDAPILQVAHNLHTPLMDILMTAITNIGLPGGNVVALVVAVWLWWRHRRAAAVAVVVSFVGAWALYTSLKLVYTR